MFKRLLVSSFGLLALAAPAFAGDAAERRLYGFSPDGQMFAFAEYGVQAGSGFPYATLYALDLSEDSWLRGAPVRVTLKETDTQQTEGDALRAVERRARRLLRQNQLSEPGRLFWSRPLTEMRGDGAEAHFVERNLPGLMKGRSFDLTLETSDAPDGDCAQYGADLRRFSLTLSVDGGAAREVYADSETLPESRGCALGYSLSDVVEGPALENEAGRYLVVLMNVFKQGFEGPDRRFLAVPVRLAAPQ